MALPVPVSVVIPTYNGAAHIRDAIRSVLAQSEQPAEVVVSDSGSSDGTVSIIREESRGALFQLRVLPEQTKGMVRNWNAAVRAATGKFVKFLFQDDVLRADCIARMLEVAEGDQRVGLVFCRREIAIEPSASGSFVARYLKEHENLHDGFRAKALGDAGAPRRAP